MRDTCLVFNLKKIAKNEEKRNFDSMRNTY